MRFSLASVWRAARSNFLIILTCTTVVALTSIVNLFTFRDIINAASGLPTTFDLSLVGVLILRFAYELLKKTLDGILGYNWQLLDTKQVIYLHRAFVDKVATLDLKSFESPHLVGLMNRAYSRLQFQVKLYLNSIIQAFASLIELGITIAIFFVASPWFAIAIVIANFIPIMVRSKNAYGVFMIYRADDQTRRRYGYVSNLVTQRETLPEIKINRAFPFIKERLTKIYRIFTNKQLKLEKRFQIYGTLAEYLPILTVFCFSLYLARQLLIGNLSTGNFVLLFTNIFVFAGALSRFGQYLGQLHADSFFIDEVREFFAVTPQITFPSLAPNPKLALAAKLTHPTIELRDVSFYYPKASTPALDHINLTIPPGQNLALIGENGAGKTTLVKLLLRMYDPTQGTILVNGVDLRNLPDDLLFSLYSCLFQSFGKFNLTVRENLELAAGKKLTEEQMIEYLKFSNAWEFIATTKHQLSQQLGPEYTDGTDLSGGEWQRLAIARAYAKQAPVLILDEPTSAVDARSEMEIFDRLNQKMRTNTLIFISHRFSTIKDAERIAVLDKGRITEDGNHQQLMQNKGKYSQLYAMQANRYQREIVK